MKKIDCRNLECPKEIKLVKKYFNSIGEGDATVIANNEISVDNIVKYAMRKGYQVTVNETDNDEYEIIIEKRGCLEVLEEEKNVVVLITTDRLGDGDDILGSELMIKYFESLSDSDILPKKVIFINTGVKFLVEDSKVLDPIKLLIERGVKIYASKLSLEYFKLNDKLIFGEVIDMDDIVELMNLADDFIRI